MNNTEAELKKRIMDAEYKIKVLEDDQKRMKQEFDTQMYFLNNDLKICEMVAKRIEENVFKLSRRIP